MDWIGWLFDFILHVDRHLADLIRDFGPWIYVLMFLIVFAETGLVVTPLLPGDSLLFALGAFSAQPNGLSLPLLMALLTVAAILGDSVNYAVGAYLAPRFFSGERVRFLNPKHLEKTHAFYEKYGAKTIILARFVPIVRTFAPFVAGMGKMTYRKFMVYNVVGAIVWVQLFLVAGYYFSNLPWVAGNMPKVILGIVIVSILPMVIEIWRERRRSRREAAAPHPQPVSEERREA